MKLINARVTFRKSPICMLEKFTFKDINHAYIYFKKYSKLTEFMILQTCNRVEIFAVVNNYKINNIRKTWSNLIGITERSFTKRLEINKDNNDAYNHILKLTSGLDSMVIGEEQILHQIKEAIIIAKKMECYGNYLNNLFEKALKIGIKIRKNTGINQNNRISIGLVATRMIEKSVPDLSHKKILLIGTGMASTTIAKSLRNKGYEFQVASRSITRAKWFSNNIGGIPLKFQKNKFVFYKYDVMFVVTSAPKRIITYNNIHNAIKKRINGIIILDLSNPRAVDENVSTIPKIKLINLDHISKLVSKNKQNRVKKISQVKKNVKNELEILKSYMNRLEAEPVIKNIFKYTDKLRKKELQKAIKVLGEKDDKRIKIINELTKSVLECILTIPMNNIRKKTENGEIDALNIIKNIFDYKKL